MLKALHSAVKDIVDVVPWTDQDSFGKPGDYFLDSLIEAAYRFDLAILIFGKDDVVISRRREMPAPRDNVVFELGLFMSVMDRTRTIIICPRLWRTKLKILSDLSGLNLAEYDPPKSRNDLPASLQGVIQHVRQQLATLNIRPHVRGPTGVVMLWPQIEKHLSTASAAPQLIHNIALDMEVTWRYLHDQVLAAPHRHDVSCHVLFIDHNSNAIRRMSSRSVSVGMARLREEEIKRFCRRAQADLRSRKISFACRVYSAVPVIHGFLINNKQLFVSLCSVANRRLVGSPNPYLFVERPDTPGKDVGGAHLFTVFETWFQDLWRKGRKVWPE